MRLWFQKSAAAALLFGCNEGESDVFATHVDFTLQGPCTDVRIADVDGDGRSDLIAAIFDSDAITVLRNSEDDGSAFPEVLTISVGVRPVAVSIADFNTDQKPDIVVVNRDSNSISVLFNSSSSGVTSFSSPTDFATTLRPVSVATGDLNGDGKPDLAVASHAQDLGDATVSVFLNATAPGSASPVFSSRFDIGTGSVTNSVTFGDINGDGKLDIAGANLVGKAVVSLNQTPMNGTTPDFAPAIEFDAGGGAASVVIVDVTLDESPDLVIANLNEDSVSVLVNRTVAESASPDFEAKVDFNVGDGPIATTVVDIDVDGHADLAVANLGSGVSLLINALSNRAPFPSLSALGPLATATEPDSIAAGDLNSDGKTDLVTGNRDASVSVLLAR